MSLKLFILCAASFAIAHGFSQGAPPSDEVCRNLVPKHHGAIQTDPSPYTVEVDKRQVSPGGVVQVTITSSGGVTPFKGFLAQGRKLNYDQETGTQGRFSTANNPEFKSLACGDDNSAVTHAHGHEKNRIVLTWVAPQESGTYVILATVVQNYNTYWVRLPSASITVV